MKNATSVIEKTGWVLLGETTDGIIPCFYTQFSFKGRRGLVLNLTPFEHGNVGSQVGCLLYGQQTL